MLDPMVLEWRLYDPAQTHEVISEIYDLRLVFEPECARIAADICDDAHLKEMKRALRGMVICVDSEDKIISDLAFHRTILDATRNCLFNDLGETISISLRYVFRWGLRSL